jgi:long-chain acyl-CoA synthetase
MADVLDTINKRLAAAIRKYPKRPALSAKQAGNQGWRTYTYHEIGELARRFSLGLRALGIERGDRVALLSENRPEWAVADCAIMAAGGVTVTIYPTLPSAQVTYILQDSGSKAIIVSDAKQLEKAKLSQADSPDLSILIAMEGGSAKGSVLSFDDVLKKGDSAKLEESFESRRDSVSPHDLMSIVYTSGTTGSPKGAMLSHGNMVASVSGVAQAFPLNPPDETFLSFLPLCHVFERVTYCLSLTMGAHTYYNDSIFKLIDNMAAVKPTIMQCVPRVFESIYERVQDQVSKSPARRRRIFHWATKVGWEYAERRNAGRFVGPILALQHRFADVLVLSKVRRRFGGRLKFFVSGGAPMSLETGRFFHSIGIPILEGWGLTETTAASTANPYGRVKLGTVGIAGFGAEVKAAPDGELMIRGPHVMRGYWNHPEATAEAIDPNGWFHSGDIGEIDEDGYIKITDRKKDIIVLANGKKVAPQPIETTLKHSPYLAEVVLLGDKSDSVRALIVPNFEAVKSWAKEQGQEKPTNESLIADAAVRKLVKSEIDKRSANLADFEKIKRFALIDHAFSIESGELTPTLKVKRRVVSEKYGSLLERE